MRYAIVIEQGPKNYSAYAPDVLGCIATGATVAEVTQRLTEALAWHLAGEPLPAALTQVAYVDVAVPESAEGPSSAGSGTDR